MRRPRLTALSLAALSIAALAAAPTLAQQPQLPNLPPPPPAPIKPYQQVAVTAPSPFDDPSFVAFRKQLGDVAAAKDRAGLAKLVVAQKFFWIQDRNLADPHKSGVDNLAKAVDLGAQDGSGWATLDGYANEPTASEMPQQKGVFCAPADPIVDQKALEALGKSTGTDPSEWGYPTKGSLDVHAAAKPDSPVIEKVGMVMVRVLPDSTQPTDPNAPFFLHVATPSGKSGFVEAASLSPLGGDEMCYAKDTGGWKITGYLGGAAQ